MTPIETTETTIPALFLFTREQYYQMRDWGWFKDQKVELLEGEIWNQYGNDNSGVPALRHFSNREYYAILDAGWFLEHRVELIDGEILEMAPQKNLHAIGVKAAEYVLEHVFGTGYWVRAQASLDLRPRSIPDPDIAVVVGNFRSHNRNANPTTALLIVEVSDTTLAYDRSWKASLYAACGIADYWIVNVVDQQVEVYRNPVADASKRFGFRYADRIDLTAGAIISPLAAPTAKIAIADLLP
jgi:Uma2 family endonuclease